MSNFVNVNTITATNLNVDTLNLNNANNLILNNTTININNLNGYIIPINTLNTNNLVITDTPSTSGKLNKNCKIYDDNNNYTDNDIEFLYDEDGVIEFGNVETTVNYSAISYRKFVNPVKTNTIIYGMYNKTTNKAILNTNFFYYQGQSGYYYCLRSMKVNDYVFIPDTYFTLKYLDQDTVNLTDCTYLTENSAVNMPFTGIVNGGLRQTNHYGNIDNDIYYWYLYPTTHVGLSTITEFVSNPYSSCYILADYNSNFVSQSNANQTFKLSDVYMTLNY